FVVSIGKMEENKRWQIIVLIIFNSIWFIHFYSSFVITIMFILYWLTKSFCEDKLNKPIGVIGGLALALSLGLFWIPSVFHFKDDILIDQRIPAGLHVFTMPIQSMIESGYWTNFVTGGIIVVLLAVTYKLWIRALRILFKKIQFKYIKPTLFTLILTLLMIVLLWPKRFMRLLGSGSMPYSLEHFLALDMQRNLIQNPFGIGLIPMVCGAIAVLYLLAQFGQLFTKENKNSAIIFVLGIFTFLGVSSARFSLNLMPFRMWSFFAFSIALLSALCYNRVILRKISKPALRIVVSVLLVIGLGYTGYSTKYRLNRGRWKEGWLTTIQAQQLYIWMQQNLPTDSKVYALGTDQCIPIVFDMISFPWDNELGNYRFLDIAESPKDNYKFLKEKGYEYLVIDVSSALFHFTYTHYELPEGVKNVLFVKNVKLISLKQQLFKQMPEKFELIKEFSDTGAIFKIL
ncbi:hypothetical protein ACFL1E_07900, partial [Candidatus Omnitrophota bacterium]